MAFTRLRKCPSISTVLSVVVMKVLDVILKTGQGREKERERTWICEKNINKLPLAHFQFC